MNVCWQCEAPSLEAHVLCATHKAAHEEYLKSEEERINHIHHHAYDVGLESLRNYERKRQWNAWCVAKALRTA